MVSFENFIYFFENFISECCAYIILHPSSLPNSLTVSALCQIYGLLIVNCYCYLIYQYNLPSFFFVAHVYLGICLKFDSANQCDNHTCLVWNVK